MANTYSLPPPLGLSLKLSRARKHLRHVARILDKFEPSYPDSWRRELNAEGTHYLYSLHVEYRPNSIELLIDEAAYHLRSVLDHLIVGWLASLGQEATYEHAFPILIQKPMTRKAKKAIAKMVEGLPRETQTFVDSVQPYHRGKDAERHPLALLQRLNNRFKHESLHLLALQLQSPNVPGIIKPPSPPRGREPGDIFAEVPVEIDVEKRFEPYITVQAGFREMALGIPNIGLASINDMYNYVRDEIIRKAVTGRLPNRL